MKRLTLAVIASALIFGAVFLVVVLRNQAVSKRVETQERVQHPPQKYNESPLLRDRVDRGTLPPVDERLPDEPLVMTPPEGIGQYSSEPVRP